MATQSPEGHLLVEFAGEDKPAVLRKLMKEHCGAEGESGPARRVEGMEPCASNKLSGRCEGRVLNIMMSLKGETANRSAHRRIAAVPLAHLAAIHSGH